MKNNNLYNISKDETNSVFKVSSLLNSEENSVGVLSPCERKCVNCNVNSNDCRYA